MDGFWAMGSAGVVLSEQTDSGKFQSASGFYFWNPCDFEHLLPLLPSPVLLPLVVLLFFFGVFHSSLFCSQCLRLTVSYLGDCFGSQIPVYSVNVDSTPFLEELEKILV